MTTTTLKPELRQGGNLIGLPDISLDLSLCANPLGPSPRADEVLKTFDARDLLRPPYGAVDEYLAAVARDLGVKAKHLTPGSGVSSFITMTSQILRKEAKRGRVAVITPDYSGTLCRFRRADLITPPPGTYPSVERRLRMVHRAMETHRYVVMSNPSNPEGLYLPPGELLDIARGHPHSLLVVDEEYVRFQPGAETLAGTDLRNVVVWQSTGKTFGLVGTRAGTMWTRNKRMTKRVRRLVADWPLSAIDVAICVAALADTSWRQDTLRQIRGNAYYLEHLLGRAFGAQRVFGTVHFRFVALDNPAPIAKYLEGQGIAVRTFSSTVPGHLSGIRVLTPIGVDDRERLSEALYSCPADLMPR